MSLNNFIRTLSRCVVNTNGSRIFNASGRCLRVSNARLTSTNPSPNQKEKVKVTFVMPSGEQIEAEAKVNDTLLDVVVENDLNIDGFGACEGTLTCSTCHVILKQEDYDRLPQEPLDEERDMLDLAYGLTETSRLGCQIQMTKELDGLEVQVPETINDAR